jgi:HK97 family phage major capsid protein
MTEHKTVAELATELKRDFDTKHDQVKAIAEDALGKARAGEDMTKSAKEIADQALSGLNSAKGALDALTAQVADLEQKASRPGGNRPEAAKGYGQQLAESDKLKSFIDGGAQGSTRIELKAITTASGSAGGMIVSQRETDVVAMPTRPDIILRDLLTVVPVTTGSIDYAKQTTRTNAAAPVAEGTTKPYSNYGWSRVSTNVRTLAHLAKLTKQALDDAPRLQAEVDAEMRYGLALAEDAQILLGDGTGENLYGLMPQATSFALPTGANAPANSIDKLRAAMLQAILASTRPMASC